MTQDSVVAIATACVLTMSCNPSSGPEQPSPPSTRFVAFRSPQFLIDRLEKPTEPPYAAGSTRAGDLLTSSDRSVVDVDPTGNLIAHRNGKVLIRTSGGAVLQVTVFATGSLRVNPSALELEPGKSQDVQVIADSGEPVPSRAINWRTSDPNIAVAVGSAVQAGRVQGKASLTAALGEASVELPVVVTARPPSPTAGTQQRH
jgi:hypothetical protein